jgi:hypothetical protein
MKETLFSFLEVLDIAGRMLVNGSTKQAEEMVNKVIDTMIFNHMEVGNNVVMILMILTETLMQIYKKTKRFIGYYHKKSSLMSIRFYL